MPDLNFPRGDKNGKRDRGSHLHQLRADQQVPAVHAVGNHAAEEGKQEDRDVAQERVEPEKKRRLVISNTSQFCAISCIHVPMLDVQAPNQRSRKSRYWKALKTRAQHAVAVSIYGSGFSRWIRWRRLPSRSLKKTSRLPLVLEWLAGEVYACCPAVAA